MVMKRAMDECFVLPPCMGRSKAVKVTGTNKGKLLKHI